MRSQIVEKERLEKELHLKQLQIKSLLTITQAINDNVSAGGLYNMYKSFLNWEMGVKKMALFVKGEDEWNCACQINAENILGKDYSKLLHQFNRLHKINTKDDKRLRQFEIVIPVYHKEEPIAFSLIGQCGDNEDIYSKIQFITTITNIVAVAIENKKLFKQQLERVKLRREIELASEVQNMLIPNQLPRGKSFELASIYKPHFNVGGDYFDFIPISEDHFVICIADISGKGVAAALLMSNFQANLRNFVFRAENLVELVKMLNQSVYQITKSDKFLTLFIAQINIKERFLKYINAGHFPPVLYTNGSVQFLNKGSTIIGAFEELESAEEGYIPINDDITLLTFTDGLTDLQNVDGEYFDETKLKSFLSEYHRFGASELNHQLMKEMENFNGEPSFPDDIAVLTCKLFLKGMN